LVEVEADSEAGEDEERHERHKSVSWSLEASFNLKLGQDLEGFDVVFVLVVMLGCVYVRPSWISSSFLSL
jgi:hypothetical protein